jgi:hypothetical protein
VRPPAKSLRRVSFIDYENPKANIFKALNLGIPSKANARAAGYAGFCKFLAHRDF